MPTRRNFCKQALGLGAVATLDAIAGETKPNDVSAWMKKAGGPRGWRIAAGLNGFMSSSSKFKKTYPIWEVLDFARREGFEGIELVQGWPQGGYPGSGETARVQALRDLYTRYNVKIFSIQTSAGGAFRPDRSAREAWLAQFRDRATLAHRLGCECIGIWPGGGLGTRSSIWTRACSDLLLRRSADYFRTPINTSLPRTRSPILPKSLKAGPSPCS